MSKRIDKFSFFVGVFFVCLIIGCIAQVVHVEDEGRYRALLLSDGAGGDVQIVQPGTMFAILDTTTGTVNRWTGSTIPIVHEILIFKEQ